MTAFYEHHKDSIRFAQPLNGLIRPFQSENTHVQVSSDTTGFETHPITVQPRPLVPCEDHGIAQK